MVVTNKTYLPSEEELTVPEVNLSWPVLHAAAFYMGKYCEEHNNEFMLCRKELDAVRCVNEGKAVTACALDFLRKLKKNCYQEFDQYYNCVYRSSSNVSFMPCRNTQEVLDKCVFEHMNIERPSYGYFCEVKVHDTKRPKPVEDLPEYEPIAAKLPEDVPKPPARFGSRWWWGH
ncbi:NADH dehydrogenase [ubiquinone] 1 alpha subcomplex subunit 8 [Microplitis mediator]|uniref:NADH dehydrogenase [ubiquinone] 1 alpha subcomplex subunit 8 n=1 Tax=Microplitis mediator TaxID=375433 RepID=UPI002552D5F1|nr:NADH dehydrogenase [ubiquinone] 1 alpha subcomplex subunit 8 [Microplitis mediator]